MANSYLQVRVNEEDKERASQILDDLGTNLSTVVNMLIKQIIITDSIPFEIKKGPAQVNRTASPLDAPVNPAAAATASAEQKETMIENPVLKGIREEYESF